MNKLLTATLLLIALISGLGADAALVSFKIKVDKPANISAQIINAREITAIDLSSGEAVVSYYTSDENYLELSPLNNATYSVVLTTADGQSQTLATDSDVMHWGVNVPASWADAVVSITTKTPGNDSVGTMHVTLTGSPDNVQFSVYGRKFTEMPLVEGAQDIEFNIKTDKYCYIVPVGIEKFFSVKVNGEEIEPQGIADEKHKITFQYSFSPADGMTVDIEVTDPTSVATVICDAHGNGDVYNLGGVLVKRAADATTLPSGVYIIDHKKVIVK